MADGVHIFTKVTQTHRKKKWETRAQQQNFGKWKANERTGSMLLSYSSKLIPQAEEGNQKATILFL